MTAIRLMPVAGINNTADDDALWQQSDSPRLFVRDAVNVDINPSGRVRLRKSGQQTTDTPFKNLWQSPLHQDVFASLDNQLVKVDPDSWSHEVIYDGVDTSLVCYELINNAVFISTTDGIFIYKGGATAQALTIDTPATPMLSQKNNGQLYGGTYTVAIAWLKGQVESGLSESASIEIGQQQDASDYDKAYAAIHVALPYCLDDSVTGVRVYVTSRNGASLMHYGDYPVNSLSIDIHSVDGLGMAAKFEYLSPMPAGRMMKYWNGRLLTADKNILRFSQALTYHLHDERHDFVLLPERITFAEPVDGGIWVGQVTHVVFLSGATPGEMALQRKSSRAPVPFSSLSLDSQQVGSEISQGGGKTALWLAENGYILGTSSGQVIELHAGIMKGISAKSGTSVVLDRRIQTAVV